MSNSSNKKIVGNNPSKYVVKSNSGTSRNYCDTCTELEGKCGCYSKSQIRGNKKKNNK